MILYTGHNITKTRILKVLLLFLTSPGKNAKLIRSEGGALLRL